MIDTSKTAENEVLSFLALCDLRGVGFETLKRVARERLDFSAFFTSDLTSEIHKKITVDPSFAKLREHFESTQAQISGLDAARHKLDYLQRRHINVIFPHDAAFPTRLNDLRDTPPWLFVEGNRDVFERSAITAVGSRKVSAEGKWLATYFGFCLEDIDVVTVSGLAEGIDQIVHRASLSARLPTIAVLGTGILSDYPKGSQDLRQRIVDGGGAVVTEYLPNDTFSAKNFVRRNRIQAALGQVVLPIEWSEKSGTAHTVRFASELDRPLAFLRAPSQPPLDWVPREFLGNSNKFTLPREHENFMQYLRSKINEQPAQKLLI